MSRLSVSLFCLVFWLAGVAAQAAPSPLEDRRAQVRVSGPGDDAVRLLVLAARCQSALEAVLGIEGRPAGWVEVAIGREHGLRQGTPLGVELSPDMSVEEALHQVLCVLLRRQATVYRAPDDPPVGALDWIAAGLVLGVLRGDRGASGPGTAPDYEPARVAFKSGRYPVLERLVNAPVRADWGPLYRLYALHCQLLLATIAEGDRSSPSRLLRILTLEARGSTPASAVALVLAEALTPGEALQGWYEREITRISRRGRHLSVAEEVAQRLHEIETVPTVTPGAQGRYGATGIPIETAVAEGARFSYSLDGEAIARLVGLLYELQQDAPLTLREPIVMYIQALDKLLRGEKRFFGWRIRRARSAFQHALDHQRRIDSYTDQVADSAIPWQERLAPYLEVLRADDERWRRVWPDLHAYLDGLPTAASDPAEQRTAMPAPAWVRP